jgi:D-alanyl-D-alanine carboxypeptidase
VLDDAVSAIVDSGAPGALALAAGPWGERYSVAGVDAFGEPLRPTARLEVGSVTKVLVAALVLLLAEDGVLGLDDGVASHMPGLLRDDGNITVRSLLNHTSGLPDFFEDAAFRAAWQKNQSGEWPAGELVRIAECLRRREPGVFSYANVNYVIVGLILEAVTGRSVTDVLEARILEPHGLVASRLPRTAIAVCGGLTTTAREVARFLAALMQGGVVREASLREMLTTVPSDWPESQGYGLGIERVESLMGFGVRGEAAWGHIGLGRATTVALATEDGTRQVVLSAETMLTSDTAWTVLDKTTWTVLRPGNG